jgi:hypothetical protein
MVYQCPTVCPYVRPFHMSRSNLRTPWPIHSKFHRVIGIDGLMVCILYGEILRQFFICRAVNWEPLCQFTSNFAYLLELIVLWSILFGEISIFHSRVMGLYSSNCRRFFVCHAVNWEPLGQFTSNFSHLLELIVLWFVYFLVKFRFFIPELWDLNYYSVLFQHKYCIPGKCSNSCLWCSCWWNLDFSFKSYGKESLYKYCMNIDDGRIMRSWRSCLLYLFIQVISFTTDKMVPGLAIAIERTNFSIIFSLFVYIWT